MSSGADILGAMNKLKDAPADLKLSPATRDRYLSIIRTYREAMQAERNTLAGLSSLGDPGQFQSAIQTRANLINDLDGAFGLDHQMRLHVTYCDALLDVVNKVASHLIKSG
jgi:hypothetical protein